jgi:hypothetical protein
MLFSTINLDGFAKESKILLPILAIQDPTAIVFSSRRAAKLSKEPAPKTFL